MSPRATRLTTTGAHPASSSPRRSERNPLRWSHMTRNQGCTRGGFGVIFVVAALPSVVAASLDLGSVNLAHGRVRVCEHIFGWEVHRGDAQALSAVGWGTRGRLRGCARDRRIKPDRE